MTGMGPTFNGGGLRFTECDFFSKASGFGKVPPQMAGAVIYFQEIPSYLSIVDSMGFKECTVCGLPGEALVRINPTIALSSEGQLAVARLHPDSLYFDIGRGNNWIPSREERRHGGNSSNGYGGLPLQLLPYVSSAVWLHTPPTAGWWRVGQQVVAINVTDAGTTGWICVEEGEPGVWRPISPELAA